MKFDHTYQAIPHDCYLIERAFAKPIIGEFLDLFGFADVAFEDLKFRAGDEDFAFFLSEAQKIRQLHKGIENRRLNLRHRWDPLLFVLLKYLSESGQHNDLQLVRRAITGGDILGEVICSASGAPLRFNSAFETNRIAACLSRLDSEVLGRFWNEAEMEKAGVIGIHETDGIREPNLVGRDLERLRDFYNSAAHHGEA
ncbi:MAG TPA: DUF1877 family protein, partial [Pyrinomonadaceae bacterium]|nr:DUF1877 family protein [Pyrinomonadaceae bacterium]